MRPALFILLPLSLACSSESTPKTFNDSPLVLITSHSEGAALDEGMSVLFRAQASDSNHNADELEVAWFLDDAVACDWAVPSAAGESSCEIAPSLSNSRVVVEVRDTEGAGGRDEIGIAVIATAAPEAFVFEPIANSMHYSDQLIAFHVLISDAEDSPDQLSATWTSSLDGTLLMDMTPDSNGEIQGATFLSEGQHFLELTVEDSSGKVSTESVLITVGEVNAAPSCQITAPVNGYVSPLGEPLIFEAAVADANVSANELAINWYSDVDGLMGSSVADTDGGVAFVSSALSEGLHTVQLQVEDEAGALCTDSVFVTISGAPSFVAAATISPATGVYTGDTLTCNASASDLEDGFLSPSIVWQDASGATLGSGPTLTLTAANSEPGHDIICLATAIDSDGNSASSTDSVMVENTPPTVDSLNIAPYLVYTNDTLTATAQASDPDEQPLSISYEWHVVDTNGNDTIVQSGPDATLDGAIHFDRDEQVYVSASADDGMASSGGLSSNLVAVENSLPTAPGISLSPTNPMELVDDLICTIVSSGTDADNDAVSHVIEWFDPSGALVQSSGGIMSDTLSASLTSGGTWTCQATAWDGAPGGSVTETVFIDSDCDPMTLGFSTCGQAGMEGPNQGQCDSAYSGTDISGQVSVISGIQSWTAPYTGTYRITAIGAGGGLGKDHSTNHYATGVPGKGASISGDFALNQGDELQIVVGQVGPEALGFWQKGGGGGGGSYVALANGTPLLVAGGGGGAGRYDGNNGGDALSSELGGAGLGTGGAGGSGGNGGEVTYCTYGGNSGAGFYGDGISDCSNSVYAKSFLNGSEGSNWSDCWYDGNAGGFGGGGGTGPHGGGGGGGYSGGGGGGDINCGTNGGGGGGGSYNSGLNQSQQEGVESGDGSVTIEIVCN